MIRMCGAGAGVAPRSRSRSKLTPLRIPGSATSSTLDMSCSGRPSPSHLQPDGGDETLDLGRLEALLGVLLALLGGQRPLQHVLAHVVLLAEVEQLADLVGALRSEPARDRHVREAGDLLRRARGDVSRLQHKLTPNDHHINHITTNILSNHTQD